MRRRKRLPQYEHKERTFRVKKGYRPEEVLVEPNKWLMSQSSKATVKVEDETGKVVASRSRSAKGDLTMWTLKGPARRWVVP